MTFLPKIWLGMLFGGLKFNLTLLFWVFKSRSLLLARNFLGVKRELTYYFLGLWFSYYFG